MWQIDNLTLRRFQSHLETYIEFKNGETTMVYGNIADEIEGADSNGSGKSVIVRGITIGLVGIPNRDLGKEDYVMDFAEEAEIILSLSNKTFKQTLVIERTIHRKNSGTISLIENGVRNKQITSPDEGNAKVLQLLDISKDDLLNYYIINQDNSHSFFKATDGAKKEIISRFTNTDLLDEVLQEVEADLMIADSEITECRAEMTKIDTRIESLEEQVEYEVNNREKENQNLLQQYKEQIDEIDQEVKLHLDGQNNLRQKLLHINDKLKNAKKIKDEKNFETKKQKTKLALSSKKQEIRETEQLIGELNLILSEEITCPSCGHKFSNADPEADLKALSESKEECNELLKGLRTELEEFENDIQACEEEIDQIKTQKRELSRINDQIEEANEAFNKADRKIANLVKEVETIEAKISKLDDYKLNSKRVKELQSEIAVLRSNHQRFSKKIEEKEAEKHDIQFWKINFSEMGLKTFLINKVLENLEGHINNTLTKFRVDLMVKINGFTVTKGGKVNEKIDILVSKDGGKLWKPYKRFSGGQRERVNVSGILTLHKLINDSSKYGGLNFLALDEFFEGLDVKGQKAVLPILEASGITCIVISHMNNNVGAKNEIFVNFEDGISTVAA